MGGPDRPLGGSVGASCPGCRLAASRVEMKQNGLRGTSSPLGSLGSTNNGETAFGKYKGGPHSPLGGVVGVYCSGCWLTTLRGGKGRTQVRI